MQFVILLTAGLCTLTSPVLGASPDRRHSPHVSTVTPLPIDVWPGTNVLNVRGNGTHRVVEPPCDQAIENLAHISATELSNGMQDGVMEWWSKQIENPIPLFPACLQNITAKMGLNLARHILAGKHSSEFDNPILMHGVINQISAFGTCKETFEVAEASVFHGTGGAFHLLSKFAAWLRLRPDRQDELREACMVRESSMVTRRHARRSPCKTASKLLGKQISSGIAGNPWQHRVRKWWSKNHNRLLRLLHSDYHNDTDTDVHGVLKGEYDDIIGMNDPVVLLDQPRCHSVCKEMVRIAGDSRIHGQWGSFHFMLKARKWMMLHPPAMAAWEDACLHQEGHEGKPVKEIRMLDVRAGADVPEAIRARAFKEFEGDVKRRYLDTRHSPGLACSWGILY